MGSEASENEQRMREYIQAWNDHDPEAVGEFFSDDCDQYSPEDARAIAETWFMAFPDLTHEIEELVADDDRVHARITLRGTHRDSFRGIPATGNEIEVADHVSTRFEDGRIVELHATVDFSTVYEQLGVSMPPDRTTTAENEAVVRRFFEALNDRDREAFVATMSEDFTYGNIEGPQEMADNDWKWIAATDLTWEVHAVHAGESYVTIQTTARGTHDGEILGLEPTGEPFEASAIQIARVEDGQITEWRAEWDFAGLLNQLGVIDPPVYGE